MNSSEVTPAENPYSKILRPVLEPMISAMEARLKENQHTEADRIIDKISDALHRLSKVEFAQKAWEARIAKQDAEIADIRVELDKLTARIDAHVSREKDTVPPAPPSEMPPSTSNPRGSHEQ